MPTRSRGLVAQAELLERTADEYERLQGGERSRNVTGNMLDEYRIRRSAAVKPADPFTMTINAAGYSAAKLAAKLDFRPSLLSMYRTGARPIPRARAEAVERLTGWAATAKNWPGGIA